MMNKKQRVLQEKRYLARNVVRLKSENGTTEYHA